MWLWCTLALRRTLATPKEPWFLVFQLRKGTNFHHKYFTWTSPFQTTNDWDNKNLYVFFISGLEKCWKWLRSPVRLAMAAAAAPAAPAAPAAAEEAGMYTHMPDCTWSSLLLVNKKPFDGMAQDHMSGLAAWVFAGLYYCTLLCLVKPDEWSFCVLIRIMLAGYHVALWVLFGKGKFQVSKLLCISMSCACICENCGVKLIQSGQFVHIPLFLLIVLGKWY